MSSQVDFDKELSEFLGNVDFGDSPKYEWDINEFGDTLASKSSFLDLSDFETYDSEKPSEIVIFIGGHGVENYNQTFMAKELIESAHMKVRIMNKTNTPLLSSILTYNECSIRSKSEEEMLDIAYELFNKNKTQSVEPILKHLGEIYLEKYKNMLKSRIQPDSDLYKIAKSNLKIIENETRIQRRIPTFEKDFQIRPVATQSQADKNCTMYGIYIVETRNCRNEFVDFFKQDFNMIPQDDAEFNKHADKYNNIQKQVEEFTGLNTMDTNSPDYDYYTSIVNYIGRLFDLSITNLSLSDLLYVLHYGFGFNHIYILDATCRNHCTSNISFNPEIPIQPPSDFTTKSAQRTYRMIRRMEKVSPDSPNKTRKRSRSKSSLTKSKSSLTKSKSSLTKKSHRRSKYSAKTNRRKSIMRVNK